MEASREFVATLASRSASAIRAIKSDFNLIGSMSLRDYIAFESVRHQANFQGESARATRKALAERSQHLG